MVRFAGQPRSQHFAGLSFVVLLHIFLIYAFLNGLNSHRSQSVGPLPLQVRVIPVEKPKQKELPLIEPTLKPAPRTDIFRLPVFDGHWPPFGPPKAPPAIIDGPPIAPPSITGTGSEHGGAVDGDDHVPAQGRGAAKSDCSNAVSLESSIIYPARAKRLGLQHGQVEVEFTVAAGGAIAIDGVTASHPVFESAALDAVKTLHCSAGRYRLPITFVLQE